MFLKKLKKSFILLFLSLFIMPITIAAYSDKLIVGGQNIGIELNASGVIVVGLYEVNGEYPARDAGLKIGDVITSINNEKCSTITDMVTSINNNIRSGNVDISYTRNNKLLQTSLKLYKDNNDVYKTGLYVKDSITGIGTLTFIDPNTRKFGALGHEIVHWRSYIK